MKSSHQRQRGQSSVEFVLIAPLLFFVFFAIIQLAYMGFVSFAVQRAAIAVARESSLTGNRGQADFYPKLIFALAPLGSLNRTTFACIAASRCQISESNDKKMVVARLHYPMPIWVPLVGRIFGEKIIPSGQIIPTGIAKDLEIAASLFGVSIPHLSFDGVHLPYFRWMIFEASVYNEGYPSRELNK
jgi:hypothetical protein